MSGKDEKDDPHSKLKKSGASVDEVKNKVTLPITCTSAYLDLYDIVDDDKVHEKRYVNYRRRGADASPCSDVPTDAPDDEEYLTEWDEWSEIEKGYGPKASWSGEVWNTLSGVISGFSPATPSESTMIKNGKCVNIENVKNKTTDGDDLYWPSLQCHAHLPPTTLIEPRSKQKAWGVSSSMLWYQGLLVELR